MRGATGRIGWSLPVAVLGLAALAISLLDAPIGWLDPLHTVAATSGIALLVALGSQMGLRSRRAREDKTSEELDGLSQRLLRLEARLSALDGSGSRASSTISDMAGDVSALSGVVRDLAEALSGQERDIAALRSRAERGSTFRAWSAPAESQAPQTDEAFVPSFFPSSDRLAAPAVAASVSEVTPPDENAILRALETGRLDLHVQPVVSLPQRRTRIFEVYALLRTSGAHVLVPEEFLPVLDARDRLPELDEKVLARAMAFARRLSASGSDALVSCALSASSIRSTETLARLQGVIEADAAIASRLVLEISQAAWGQHGAVRRLEPLGNLGLTFGLTKVSGRALDPRALGKERVRTVKVGASEILDPANADWADGLASELARIDVQLIAERVAGEETIPELIEYGVPLAQGFAFAFPSPVDSVLEQLREPADRSAPPVSRPDAVAGPEERVPLRSFLRRGG